MLDSKSGEGAKLGKGAIFLVFFDNPADGIIVFLRSELNGDFVQLDFVREFITGVLFKEGLPLEEA